MEIWKTIDGYENYQVSNLGRVKSLKYGKEKILKSGTTKQKYILVQLCKNNKKKKFLIHRLVALAFLPNQENLPQVNHIDENPSNNCVENLEWCTAEYNTNYGTRNKRSSESQTNGKKSKKVDQFSLDGRFLRTWISMGQVKRELGIAQSNISACCKGKVKSTGNFIWKFHFDV